MYRSIYFCKSCIYNVRLGEEYVLVTSEYQLIRIKERIIIIKPPFIILVHLVHSIVVGYKLHDFFNVDE